ncbi:hypothetical protein AAFF_G00007140 [Aldrovandia affinis]|uniref:Uncharacterized protein n=1 Tax=Aldrovandia affinis TaxID=143900 RepID=A0AAD7WZ35_9TELE|nr:hypothetical protein AAFF_G00007140 [Aldrovandia affinis]
MAGSAEKPDGRAIRGSAEHTPVTPLSHNFISPPKQLRQASWSADCKSIMSRVNSLIQMSSPKPHLGPQANRVRAKLSTEAVGCWKERGAAGQAEGADERLAPRLLA